MLELLSQPWPWYVAGPLIGLVVPLLLWVGGEFGVSENLRHICAAVLPTRNDFFRIRGGDRGAQAAVAGISAPQTELADEHSLGSRETLQCHVLDLRIRSDQVQPAGRGGSLAEDRAVRCPEEWDRMAKAWQRLPAGYQP